jgi:hypothetical protein
MKERMQSFFGELSIEAKSNSNSERSDAFKKHRTDASEEDSDAWNMTVSKLSTFHSPSKAKGDFVNVSRVMEENQRLRDEIKGLKELLVSSHAIARNYEKVGGSLRLRRDDRDEEVAKLKRILEKSYYSIKEMEAEIGRLREQLSGSAKSVSVL